MSNQRKSVTEFQHRYPGWSETSQVGAIELTPPEPTNSMTCPAAYSLISIQVSPRERTGQYDRT